MLLFLRKLLNGDQGLALTFWLYGVIAGMALHFVWTGLGIFLPPLGLFGASLAFLFGLMYLGYIAAWMIGLWRSASKYKGLPLFAGAAQLIVILNIVGMFLVLSQMIS